MWLTGRWARHQELTPIVKAAQYFPQFVLPFRYEVAAALPLVCAAESVERVGVGELWVRLAAALCGRTNTQ